MEYDDIVPDLLEKIKQDFQEHFNGSGKIAGLYAKVRDGTATYAEANEFAIEAGEILAGTFKRNLSSAVLPDGKMYFNIADRTVRPMMEGNYDLITDVTSQVQKRLNEDAGIGIKAIVPELNEDRIAGIVNRVSSEDIYDNVAWLLEEPIKVFSQSVVDDAIKVNAEFQYDAGLSPKIVRETAGKCCKWCEKLANTYSYPDVPKGVYQRHDFCRCTVDYVAGKKRRNVHNNNTGKRRYVPDGYGGYTTPEKARIKLAKQMAESEKVRNDVAKQTRIELSQKSKEVVLKDLADVTGEYKRKIGLTKGTLTVEDGYETKDHEKEIQVAKWLSDNFSGEITLLKEVNRDKISTPDYLWDNKLWELKSPAPTLNAIDKRLQKGLHQIETNPGGVIINLEKNELDVNEIAKKIENRLTRKRDNGINCDVMLLIEGKLVLVIRK